MLAYHFTKLIKSCGFVMKRKQFVDWETWARYSLQLSVF